MTYEIKITKEHNGVSPKNFLNKTIDVSYSTLFKLLKEKRITLNGKKIKSDSRLKTGDIIKVWKDEIKLREAKESKEVESKDLGMELIFENNDFLVLNKLPGVVVQGATDNELSLSYHLQFLKEKNNYQGDFKYFHVHRLDKDTSGVLICSKNQIALRELNKIFRERSVVKKYQCLCFGTLKKKSGKIEINLDRNPDGAKEKVKVVSKTEGKTTLSFYKVLKEYTFQKEKFTLVEVEIKTGFMHQIRVHMKYIGNPIVCDKMYGNSFANNLFEDAQQSEILGTKGILDRQFLHAKSIEFDFLDKNYKFDADFTDDLNNCLKLLK